MHLFRTIVLSIALLAWAMAGNAAKLESEVLLLDVDETTGHWSLIDKRSGIEWSSADGPKAAFDLVAGGRAIEIRYDFEADGRVRVLADVLTLTAEQQGNLIVPCREGLLFEADRPTPFKRTFDTSSYEGVHMNMIGLLKQGSGLIVTWDDAYTAVEVERIVDGTRTLKTTFELRRTARSLRLWPVGPGDWNTIATVYRGIAQDKGYAVTLRDKIARTPQLERLVGASNFKLWNMYVRRMNRESTEVLSEEIRYSFDEAAQIAEHLHRDLEIDRLLFTMGGWIKNGYDNSHPDILPANTECGGNEGLERALRHIEKFGYVTCLHDNYQDMYRNAPSYDRRFLAKKEDGSLVNWGHWIGGVPDIVCAPMQLELARRPQNLPGVKELFAPQSYFIDTTFATGLRECYDPAHPLDRNSDIVWKQRLADYARNMFGIFGSEGGREWALAHSDFFEGIAGLYGRAFDEEQKEKKLDATLIPFWEMVYHDCQICYGKYACDPKAGAQGVAQHVLFARPFYYHFGGQYPRHLYWEQDCVPVDKSVGPETWCFTPEICVMARTDSGWSAGMNPLDAFIKNSHEVLAPLHRVTAHDRLTQLQYLNADRSASRAVYGKGTGATTVTVNFGPNDVNVVSALGGDVVLPQWGFTVESPLFAAFYARRWGGVDYRDGALFTLRPQGDGDLQNADSIRIFHGFGPTTIAWNDRLFNVPKEKIIRPE